MEDRQAMRIKKVIVDSCFPGQRRVTAEAMERYAREFEDRKPERKGLMLSGCVPPELRDKLR